MHRISFTLIGPTTSVNPSTLFFPNGRHNVATDNMLQPVEKEPNL